MDGRVTSVINILWQRNREITIPVYQRNYDWGQKQCERLFDDLVHIIRDD